MIPRRNDDRRSAHSHRPDRKDRGHLVKASSRADLRLPTPYVSQSFSEIEADSLGNRWVTHQHFLPERPLLDWAARTGTHLITMIRHPTDALVSLYHYCCNYADRYKKDQGSRKRWRRTHRRDGKLPDCRIMRSTGNYFEFSRNE
jgi:hypothetical protein